MDYNTQRKKLPLPEYGRNIQNMVDQLKTIEDKEERNRAARSVIDVMGNLYTYLRDVAEFKHKLWDHLAIMSNFELDIDYPYEPPSPEILNERPNSVPYNQQNLKYRHYGLVTKKMVEAAVEMEEKEQKIMIEQLANHMKKLYILWNKDSVDDEKIFSDMEDISNGRLKVSRDLVLSDGKALFSKKKKKKKKHNS